MRVLESNNKNEIITTDDQPTPAALYLATLSPSSRKAQADALGILAALLAGDDPDTLTRQEKWGFAQQCRWELLRYEHTTLLRSEIAARYSVSTTNRILSALRNVLKSAWRLDLMTSEDYHRPRS